MIALGFYLFHLFRNFRRAGGGGGDWGACFFCSTAKLSRTVAERAGHWWLGGRGCWGYLGGLLGTGGWAGELLCHGVELEALGAGDGSLFHVEGPGADLEEKAGGTGVETLAGWLV